MKNWSTHTYWEAAEDDAAYEAMKDRLKGVPGYKEQIVIVLEAYPELWWGIPDLIELLAHYKGSYNNVAAAAHGLYHNGVADRTTAMNGTWYFRKAKE